jgi:hypothetical protein
MVRPCDCEIAQVRKRRDAVRFTNIGVGERVLDRPDDVVDRTIRHLDERSRHTLRPRFHVNRRRFQIETVRIRLLHVGTDVEQCHAFAVD